MVDFSRTTDRLRCRLLREGISFYELEQKASPDEFFESPTKSWARFVMITEGISVQDLKKGTIYEELERNGDMNKEEIEKKVKAMAMERKAANDKRSAAAADAIKGMMSFSEAMKKKKEKKKEMDAADAKSTFDFLHSPLYLNNEDVLKDKEMYPDLYDKKLLKKFAKIEKDKWIEKKLAEKARPYMGFST